MACGAAVNAMTAMRISFLSAAAIAWFTGGMTLGLRAEQAPAFTATAPRMVTSPAECDDYWPCFSADGSRLFFSRRSGGKPWQLFQVPAGGGAATPLFDPPAPPAATRVSRSSGGRLAFAGGGGIWTTGVEARNAERLLIRGLAGNPSYPSWYPDGRHLLVVAYRPGAGGILQRVDISSGEAVPLTDPAEVRAGMPCVSPDGKSILFAGQRNHGGAYDQNANSIWILAEDGKPRPLTGHQGRAATWSPSGEWIAYESNHGSPDRRQAVFIISRDGKTGQRVTPYSLDANHPVWSPDGGSLAFSMVPPGRPGHTCIGIIELHPGG